MQPVGKKPGSPIAAGIRHQLWSAIPLESCVMQPVSTIDLLEAVDQRRLLTFGWCVTRPASTVDLLSRSYRSILNAIQIQRLLSLDLLEAVGRYCQGSLLCEWSPRHWWAGPQPRKSVTGHVWVQPQNISGGATLPDVDHLGHEWKR